MSRKIRDKPTEELGASDECNGRITEEHKTVI